MSPYLPDRRPNRSPRVAAAANPAGTSASSRTPAPAGAVSRSVPLCRNPQASTSAGFDGKAWRRIEEIEEEKGDSDDRVPVLPERFDRAPADAPRSAASLGTVEEEEIEEEEADLTHYVEDLEEDALFEEMEEETRAADDYPHSPVKSPPVNREPNLPTPRLIHSGPKRSLPRRRSAGRRRRAR